MPVDSRLHCSWGTQTPCSNLWCRLQTLEQTPLIVDADWLSKMAGWTGLEPAILFAGFRGKLVKTPIWWLFSGSFLPESIGFMMSLNGVFRGSNRMWKL